MQIAVYPGNTRFHESVDVAHKLSVIFYKLFDIENALFRNSWDGQFLRRGRLFLLESGQLDLLMLQYVVYLLGPIFEVVSAKVCWKLAWYLVWVQTTGMTS